MQKTESLKVRVLSDLEIESTRMFDAPPALVFKAHSSCEHMSKWWGRTGSTLPVCEMDFRPGGSWRAVERHPDGNEYAFRGEYRDIVEPERIVYTFEFEGMPGHVSVETLTFTAEGGGTRLTNRTLFDSKEDRDGMLESGMEEGANESMERLAEYLETLS